MRTVASRLFATIIVLNASLWQARAWDYEAHRVVNQVALSALPSSFPAFVRTATAVERIAFLAGEPDRWRNTPDLPLKHLNGPDHYFDVEDLRIYGIDPENLPVFRYDFVAQTALIRSKHPEKFPVSQEKNDDHTRELIGFLPWGMAEMYGKLKSGFSYLKAYQEHGGTPEQIANAQENIIYIMGVMGHLYGDASQPLHTTKHHHGWVGENPKGYSTSRGIHSWIDGGFWAATGGFDVQALCERTPPAKLVQIGDRPARPEEIFAATVSFIVEQNRMVEPLYALDKAGRLSGKEDNKEGREFMEDRLLAGAHLLADVWLSAWEQAPPDTFLINQLKRQR